MGTDPMAKQNIINLEHHVSAEEWSTRLKRLRSRPAGFGILHEIKMIYLSFLEGLREGMEES